MDREKGCGLGVRGRSQPGSRVAQYARCDDHIVGYVSEKGVNSPSILVIRLHK